MLTISKAASREGEEQEETPEEEVYLHDILDNLKYQVRVSNLEDSPVTITVTKKLDTLRIDAF